MKYLCSTFGYRTGTVHAVSLYSSTPTYQLFMLVFLSMNTSYACGVYLCYFILTGDTRYGLTVDGPLY